MAENETQENTEEVTEAVETQSPATEKGIEEDTKDSGATSETVEEKSSENSAADGAEASSAEDGSNETETAAEEEDEDDEISYHAVEKEGEITAIWEMQGAKHIRTISPRSTEGQKILNLFTSEIHETDSPPLSAEASK